MKTTWNLDVIYKGIDDPAYSEDFRLLTEAFSKLDAFLKEEAAPNDPGYVERLLLIREDIEKLSYKLDVYVGLSQAVDTENGLLMAQSAKISRLFSDNGENLAASEKLLSSVENPEALAEKSPLIKEYLFLINEAKENKIHMLSDSEEALYKAMDATGGNAWGDLQTYLTSTLKVDYDGKEITLSEVRNLASSPDAGIRKAAYEAELKAYEKISDSVAFSLNNIKNQVTMISKKRKFDSPLLMTLNQSRMKKETLEAMIEAIKEYLPVFRKYLRKKAVLLGHDNGLPWYDLFAPVGSMDKTFTVEEARDYLLACFSEVAPDIAKLMSDAFENEWIDFFPHKGKEGGAFDQGVPYLSESRVMTNFDGSYSAVDTLAHELGHAFHDRQVFSQRIMNTDYTMPVAETASTFNEICLGEYAVAHASEKEKLALIESDLKESTQCVVDIYCRYLFETAVFNEAQDRFLMADDLNALMLECQKATYGDGLDPEYLHPCMWVCKSHYYSSGLSFYNFPYAFGNLFAIGLYALYKESPDTFIPRYKEMLHLTPVHTIEEDGLMMGVDLTKKDFWEKSLGVLKEKIETFLKM